MVHSIRGESEELIHELINACNPQVHFEDDARGKYLELLGYKKEELALKVCVMHPYNIIE